MVAVFIAVAVLAVIAAVAFLSAYKTQKIKRMSRQLGFVSQLGTKHGLNYSSQELLADAVFALDGLNKKLLVLSGRNIEANAAMIIDLNAVSHCSVQKYYTTHHTAYTWGNCERSVVARVVLCFEFLNCDKPIEIEFYNRKYSAPGCLQDIEQKARQWEIILQKMLTKQN